MGWPLTVAAQQTVVDLSLNPAQSERFVLLRNGAMFAGRVEKNNGRYTVQIDPQTTVNLDANRVWVVADSKLELFEFRRARISAYDQDAQFELWQWCLQNDMLTPVAEAVPTLREQGFPESRLRSLELGLARARGELPVPTLTPPPSNANMLSNTAPLPHRPTVNPRGTNRPTAHPNEATHAIDATSHTTPTPVINSVFSFYDQPGFDNDTRVQEAISTSIKQTAVDQFNESVHWALIQACAGCHYPENEALRQVSAFALEIPGGPNKATLEQTRHNLEQLRPLLNRDNPGNSRLLSLISEPHGGQKLPPVAADSADFRQITQWVYRSGVHQSGTSDDSHVTLAAATESDVAAPAMASPQASTPDFASLLPNLGPQVDPQRPYDPTPFNRHFHPCKTVPPRPNDLPRGPTPLATTESPRTTEASARNPLPAPLQTSAQNPASAQNPFPEVNPAS
jgi:hypothetical protein